MSFSSKLQRASWRGVPFGMELGSKTMGRRKIQHDYPYRDTVWLEDQGRLPRAFRIAGFLVGDSAIYGGGTVLFQLSRMEAAAEATGTGVLVHPTRGRLTVDLLDLVVTERWDEGNYFELLFTFIQGGAQAFPSVLTAFGDLVQTASLAADMAGLGSFVSGVAGPLLQGLDAAEAMSGTAAGWIDKMSVLGRDATSLFGTVSLLGGADYGRFFNGRNAGFLAGLSSPYAGAASIADLITAGAAQRALISSAGEKVQAAIGGLGVSTKPADVATAAQSAVAALQGSAADPADGIRLLTDLSRFTPASAPANPAATATSDLFRRAATVALARVSATYAPSSADNASAARNAVLTPIDAEINTAGNSGADDVFQTFKGLRKSVVDDLGSRGGALARLTEIAMPMALPAAVIAQQQYGDVTRAPELVTQAIPVHPWFMPTQLTALAD